MKRFEMTYDHQDFVLEYTSKQVNDYTSYLIRIKDERLLRQGDSVYVFLICNLPSINPYFMPEVFRFRNSALRWAIKKALAMHLGIACYEVGEECIVQGKNEDCKMFNMLRV